MRNLRKSVFNIHPTSKRKSRAEKNNGKMIGFYLYICVLSGHHNPIKYSIKKMALENRNNIFLRMVFNQI